VVQAIEEAHEPGVALATEGREWMAGARDWTEGGGRPGRRLAGQVGNFMQVFSRLLFCLGGSASCSCPAARALVQQQNKALPASCVPLVSRKAESSNHAAVDNSYRFLVSNAPLQFLCALHFRWSAKLGEEELGPVCGLLLTFLIFLWV